MSQNDTPTQTIDDRLEAARKRLKELRLRKQTSAFTPELTRIQVTTDNSQQYQDEIDDLKTTIELQRNQIKKLRDENTDLKLERMDLSDKIAELQSQLAHQNEVPALEHPTAANAPIYPTSIHEPTGDIREKLLAWSGWQVDMREWSDNKQVVI